MLKEIIIGPMFYIYMGKMFLPMNNTFLTLFLILINYITVIIILMLKTVNTYDFMVVKIYIVVFSIINKNVYYYT